MHIRLITCRRNRTIFLVLAHKALFIPLDIHNLQPPPIVARRLLVLYVKRVLYTYKFYLMLSGVCDILPLGGLTVCDKLFPKLVTY